MRYLAEIISPNTIAVWSFKDEDMEDLLDGIHELIGDTISPIFPSPICFEYSIAPESHFVIKKYSEEIKKQKGPPPFLWICLPHFVAKEKKGQQSRLSQAFYHISQIDFQEVILTDILKSVIIETFENNEDNFREIHQIYKTLTIVTL